MSGFVQGVLLASTQPFSWNLIADVQQMLSVDFMRSAFLSGSLIAVTCGLVGYFVLLRSLTFASDALSHVGFAGAMAAAFLGLNPYVGLFGSSIIVGIGMGQLGRSSARSRDVAIGTVLAWILGLGALFLGLYLAHPVANTNIAVGVGILFGSIFGVDARTALVISVVGVATSIALIVMARPLLFASLDPDVARARGLPVRLLDGLFLALLAITVAEAVPAVGALLVFALLVTPAASVRSIVRRPYVALVLSAALALVITWVGLTMAFYLSYPVSFDISALGFAVYLVLLAFQRAQALIREMNKIIQHPDGEALPGTKM
ncbi:MAG TPA: metal ABC transporter permease [Ktedonobacteraceae bacterium]|nr:metal ABC transporter permease [Ktedonobacteraceae bacterium]